LLFGFTRARFFLKKERVFSFGVLPSKYSGSVAGLQCGRGKAKTIFAGGKGFCFASALFVLGRSVPPRRRVREECAADFFILLYESDYLCCKKLKMGVG